MKKKQPRKRNPIAAELKTQLRKYRMRVVKPKKGKGSYNRKVKSDETV